MEEELEQVVVNVPGGWEDVTVDQFMRLQKIEREGKSDLAYMVAVIEALCDVPADVIREADLDNAALVISELTWITQPITAPRREHVMLDGVKHTFKPSAHMTVGEALTVETVIDLEELNYITAMDVVLAVMLRAPGQTEFDANSFVEMRAKCGRLKVTEVYADVVFFSTSESARRRSTTLLRISRSTKISGRSWRDRIRAISVGGGWRWLTSWRRKIS